MKSFADYCTPARVYLGIQTVALVIVVIQNLLNQNSNELCIGVYKCTFLHKTVALVFKVIFMLLWAWFLNFLCKKGLTTLAWFILLIPILLIAILFGGIILAKSIDDNSKIEKHYYVTNQ